MSRAEDYQMHRGDTIVAIGHVVPTYWPERYQSKQWEIAKQPRPSRYTPRVIMRKKCNVEGAILGWTRRWMGGYVPPSVSQGYYDSYPEYEPGYLMNMESVNMLAVSLSVGVTCRYKPTIYVLPEDVIVCRKLADSDRPEFFMDFTCAIFEKEIYLSETMYATGHREEAHWASEYYWRSLTDRRVHCPKVESPVGGMHRKCLYEGWQLPNCIPLGYTHRATGILQESGHAEKWRKWELAQKTWHKVLVVSPEGHEQRFTSEALAFPKES
jgi:hypothetical protein